MSPRVTIGLSYMNNEDTLPLVLASIFAQSFCDWELLLVDDGSTDGSSEIARSIQDPRVRAISDGQNKGLSTRLNEIADLATSELLARMDADDLMHPKRLERQVEFLDKYPQVDVVGTGIYSVDRKYRVVGSRCITKLAISPAAVLKRSVFSHPTIMGRTRWFRSNRYDPSFVRAEDRELWCRTFQTSKFALMDDFLLFYREVGVFNITKYLKSTITDRKILKRYGPSLVGIPTTCVFYAYSHLKSMLYRAAVLVRVEDLLVKARNSRLSPSQIAEAESVVCKIKNIEVPGLFFRKAVCNKEGHFE